MNGPLKFLTARKILPLLELLAKFKRVLACSLHRAKSMTGFKLCATTSNNMQQGVQTDATCNIQQCWKLLANNVASVARSLRLKSKFSLILFAYNLMIGYSKRLEKIIRESAFDNKKENAGSKFNPGLVLKIFFPFSLDSTT